MEGRLRLRPEGLRSHHAVHLTATSVLLALVPLAQADDAGGPADPGGGLGGAGGGETLSIAYPVDPSTVAAALGVAGGSILLVVLAWWGGFALVRRLFRRVLRAS